MMFRGLIVLIVIFRSIGLLANDGAFYSKGGNLYPFKETTIELKKEILEFTKADKGMRVDIYFEFFNPSEEKELTVGFVSPFPSESDGTNKNYIYNFRTFFKNELLPYSVNTDQENEQFIYSFTINFKQGTNVIKHSYEYSGASFVGYKSSFAYTITTGKSWANSEIEDFELYIYTGLNQFVSIPYSFWNDNRKIDWNLTGVGKIRSYEIDDLFKWEERTHIQRAYIQSGRIHFKAKHFKPDRDINITFEFKPFNCYLYHSIIKDKIAENINYTLHREDHVTTLTNQELRQLRNALFAFHGYKFKSEDLYQYFIKYEWYIADASVQSDKSLLSDLELRVLDKVVEEENKRKQ